MKVTKCCEALGARIEGVDLSMPLDAETVESIKRAWWEHQVIVFPNQNLTSTQHISFSEQFGEMMEHPMTKGMPAPIEGVRAEYRELLPVTRESGTNGWHTDITGMAVPPSLALLYGIQPLEIEGVDDDTLFCNQYRTYEQLSPGLQSFLQGRYAVHSMKTYRRGKAPLVRAKNLGLGEEEDTFRAEDDPTLSEVYKIPAEQLHPCVRQHPETGRLSVYCDTASTKCFEGWTRKESLPILEKIVEVATREDNIYRHKWKRGDMVCWDNRCTMHCGPPAQKFPPGTDRFLVRITVIPKTEVRPFDPSAGPGRPVDPSESLRLAGVPDAPAVGANSRL